MPSTQVRLIHLSLILLLVLALLSADPSYAVKAPEEIRRQAISLSPEAENFMQSIQISQLAENRYFGEMLLRMLSRPDLSDDQKVDVFYAMLKSIGWGFSGAVRIPAYYNYFQVFGGYVSSFLRYQENVELFAYEVSGLLEIARRDAQQRVSHASHALLLAMLLNAKDSKASLEEFLDAETIQQAQVPAIWLHYLAFAVVLSREATLALKMGDLLDSTDTEEGQEDILCALGVFEAEENFARIKQFIHDTLETDYNQAVETAVLITKQRLSPNDFYIFYMELLSEATRTFQLKELQERQFRSDIWRDNAKKIYLKVWDNFDLRIYDDGILLTYKNIFSDFI